MLKEKENVLQKYPDAKSRAVRENGDLIGFEILAHRGAKILSDVAYTRDMAWKHASDRMKKGAK